MKKLYIIGGTMGVGKSTVCRQLNKILPNSVFLDGDWCWNMDPFTVNDETRKMVMENIIFLLNQFIRCSVYDNIIFCWVLHQQNIIDDIIDKLDITRCDVKVISITCSKENLIMRLNKDIEAGIRQDDIIKRSVERIDLYNTLDTIKIDTTDKDVIQICDEITNC